jgi:hypothetical protein
MRYYVEMADGRDSDLVEVHFETTYGETEADKFGICRPLDFPETMQDTDVTDEVNEWLDLATSITRRIVAEYPDRIRPHEAARAFAAGFLIGDFTQGDREQTGDIMAPILVENTAEPNFFTGSTSAVKNLPNELLADILLQLPLTEGDDPDGRVDRALALTVADHIGPDWAQSLYRFAVLVTKLT